jgi:hypothetical protein
VTFSYVSDDEQKVEKIVKKLRKIRKSQKSLKKNFSARTKDFYLIKTFYN